MSVTPGARTLASVIAAAALVASGCGGSSGGGGPTPCDGVESQGRCCASPGEFCGSGCCPSPGACLLGSCVSPGGACTSAADCDAGAYCEPLLSPDPPPGAACPGVSPSTGRCLPLPPETALACENVPAPAAAGSALPAVEAWTWRIATARPDFVDVWTTPVVGRLADTTCDGQVDGRDSPVVVVLSGRAVDVTTGRGTCCQCTNAAVSACRTASLRVLDGRTGAERWTLDAAGPSSVGFAGVAPALGDVNGDGKVEIAAVTGEGCVVLVDGTGAVLRTSSTTIPGAADSAWGWGGALAIADMEGDGFPEIAYGATVFDTTGGAITARFSGVAGLGGPAAAGAISTFADLDGATDRRLELLAGRTAYRADGTLLWNRSDLPDGFVAVADFEGAGQPQVVLVGGGRLWLLQGTTGATLAGPLALPGTGAGGPPLVADLDGDGRPEIGVAMAQAYVAVEPTFAGPPSLAVAWQVPTHDLSSSETGSTAFDFEGDGAAEVVYGDECFAWVLDGRTGAVRQATSRTSSTGTESLAVADVDGDGHAEIVVPSNRADPSPAGWRCLDASGQPVAVNGIAWTPSPDAARAYGGVAVLRGPGRDWAGARTIWASQTDHVTNVCTGADGAACASGSRYGQIPAAEVPGWTVPWANGFRENRTGEGRFDAADGAVWLEAACSTPVRLRAQVRNLGRAVLPPVTVWFWRSTGNSDVTLGSASTELWLGPGQIAVVEWAVAPGSGGPDDAYRAALRPAKASPPAAASFMQCAGREEDDVSGAARPACPE